MVISVASGKGGTGKTTVAVNLALSIMDTGVQFLDCDVEEPNANIFIKSDIKNKIAVSIPVPEVDKKKCVFCGKCAQVCAFNAIAVFKKDIVSFQQLCHGCGSCSYFCTQKAIKEIDKEIGSVETGIKGNLQFAHGILNIGEAVSVPLIKAVKKYINPTRTVIIDAPPGTSCPVIETVKESDFCVLVTEPTPFGLNDLVLAVEMLRKLSVLFGVVINRSDMGDDKVEKYCEKNNIPVLMSIPFDREIAMAYSKGISMIKVKDEYINKFRQLLISIQLKWRSCHSESYRDF
ncbi:MAG: ATP-binding protein [bacterium]